jgi:Tol biopolymer transport system component
MRVTRRAIVSAALAAALVTTLAPASPAGASYPGHDGRIAYDLAGDIYTVNPTGQGTKRLTFTGNNSNPRWSKDGKKIAFERAKDVYTMNADGTAPHRVTFTGRAHEPAWSPDGTRIAFANVMPSGHGDIFTVSPDGGPITRLTFDDSNTCGNGRPTWSPLGNIIAFHQCTLPDFGSAIRTVDATSHRQRLVIKEPGADHPDFRPGGVKILYMASCIDPRGETCTPSQNPVEIHPDGTGRTHLFLSVGADGEPELLDVCSAPDGSDMAVTEATDGNYDIAIYHHNTVIGQQVAHSATTLPRHCDWQPLP